MNDQEVPPERRERLLLIGVLAAAAALYAPLVGAGFAWDDQFLILDLQASRGGSLGELFAADLWSGTAGEGGSRAYYRPLIVLDFQVLSRLFGASAFVFHAVSVALHLVVGGLLFGLLRRLGPEQPAWLAGIGTALFLVHPLQQEAVAFISARNDLWAGLACVLALHAWLAERRLLAAGLIFAGLLFKETTVAVVPAIAVLELTRGERSVRRLAPLGGAVLVYLLLRWRADVGSLGLDPGGFGVLGAYVAHWTSALLLPLDVGPYRPLGPVLEAGWTLPVAGLGLGLGVALAAGRRTVTGVVLAAGALGLAFPASASLGGTADRYAYVALLGLALAVPPLLERAPTRAAVGVGSAVVLACFALNMGSLPRWHDHASLMAHGEAADLTGRAAFELAKSLSSTGDFAGARDAARRSVTEPWPNPAAWPLLAAMELTLGDPQAALDALDAGRRSGLEEQPSTLINRAAANRLLGRPTEVEAAIAGLVERGIPEAEARARLDRVVPP